MTLAVAPPRQSVFEYEQADCRAEANGEALIAPPYINLQGALALTSQTR
jgi:hypothetical protein